MFIFFLLYLTIFLFCLKSSQCVLTTRGAPPIITSITPNRGGVEGGTRITIKGYNFNQKGLFSNQVVFIGDGVCKILKYYSNDGQIQCITPKCTTLECLSSSNWQGEISVSVLVSTQTVEGIFTVSSTFTYSGYYTPELLRMSHYTWGTATSFISGRISAAYLDDVSVLFSSSDGYIGNRALVGDPMVLNDELYKNTNYNWQKNSYSIYYRPPEDMTAGFYNLTLNVQDLQGAKLGNGMARSFPSQIPYSYANSDEDFTLIDNFDASASGTVFSVVLLPAVSRVYPVSGSINGGTILTISGYGFSKNVSNNVVYASGELCEVISATFNSIQCKTSPIASSSLQTYINSIKYQTQNDVKVPLVDTVNFKYNSTRNYGSIGWYVKVWDWQSYSNNKMTDDLVRFSFGLKQGLAFGFYYNIGSNWVSSYPSFNQNSPTCPNCFAADFSSVLIVPYTGLYVFHMNSDDNSYLYGSLEIDGQLTGPEVLLMSVGYSTPGDFISRRPKSTSSTVRLSRGERYHLRVRLVNSYGPDYIQLAMQVTPEYDNSTGFLVDGLNSLNQTYSNNTSDISLQTPVPLSFSDEFLHHHSLKDIQLLSVSMDYKYEIQTITIWGIQAGTFDILIQDQASTASVGVDLDIASSNSYIASSMQTAVKISIDPTLTECSSFAVDKKVATITALDGTKSYTVTIAVTFVKDNIIPFTLLDVNTGNLQGTFNLSYVVKRSQLHSTAPSGTFDLNYYFDSSTAGILTLPYNIGRNSFRTTLQSLSSEITVDIGRRAGANNYLWSITFIKPRGEIPLLKLNTSNVVGDNVKGYIQKIRNGSSKSLWFDPIPAWITEVPLRSMERNSINGNVEVYVRADSGDVLKSVCDSTGDSGYDIANSMLKGGEASCAYKYNASVSAIVSNFSLSYLDQENTKVYITGNFFLLGNTKTKYDVSVSIADHNCNITYINDQNIECTVSSVPWGVHAPIVYIAGVGNAVIAIDKKLTFKQSVYSVYPIRGSFAGGQVITIKGRGFRPTVQVIFEGISEPCSVISWSSSEISCRTPASTVVFTHQPSSLPSSFPSYTPSCNPTHQPSSQPSYKPVNHPTTMPLTKPSSQPSQQPLMKPSVHPTVLPLSSPTSLPKSLPTEKPIKAPSIQPSCQPANANPTSSPSTQPNLFPSTVPQSMPSQQQPSCQPSSSPSQKSRAPLIRRHLVAHSSNMFNIYVDGFNSSVYTYDIANTPIIQSMLPLKLPSSISTNVTFSISNYGSDLLRANLSILIGDQSCGHIVINLDNTVSCWLSRSPTQSQASTLIVRVNFIGKGYAGLKNSINILPTAERGFEVYDIFPKEGSVLGGNTLLIRGFGFNPTYASKYSVQLSMQNLIPFTEYDLLLESLGFSTRTTRAPDEIINCTVINVNYTHMSVLVPDHQSAYNSNNYSINIAINGISSVCYSLSNCTYAQQLSVTPVISQYVRILNFTNIGEYFVEIHLYKVNNKQFSVFVGNYKCTILDVRSTLSSNSSELVTVVKILTPPLPSGNLSITAIIDTKGNAISYAQLPVTTFIESVHFDSSKGSLAGGTSITVKGRGFSSICLENVIIFSLMHKNNNKSFSSFVTEFISCTTTEMNILSPSILASIPTTVHSHQLSNYQASLEMLSTYIGNGTSDSQFFDKSTFTFKNNNKFLFSLDSTPLLVSNISSGYSGDVLNIRAYTNGVSSKLPVSIKIGTKNCESIRLINTTNSILKADISIDCVIPELSAVLTSYVIYANFPPLGYGINNASIALALSSFKSLLKLDKLRPFLINSSVLGGVDIDILGKGISSDIQVSVCNQNCTASYVSYNKLLCTSTPHMTVSVVDQLQIKNISVDLVDVVNGTYFGSASASSSYLTNVYDGDATTYIVDSSYSKSCYIGIKLPSGLVVKPYRLRFYPQLQQAVYFSNVIFEGSHDGGKTYTILGSASKAHEGWNFIDAINVSSSSSGWFTSLRYRAADTKTYSHCKMAEIEFLGIVAYQNESCPIVVKSISSNKFTTVGQVYYGALSDVTPFVYSITPNNGTALGGDLVRISGINFSPGYSSAPIVVKFSGVECRVVRNDSSSIDCITGQRKPENIETSSISVLIPGKGYSIVESTVEYLYIDKWSALTSWMNQEPPVDGDIVWIPDGQVLSLDVQTPILTFLLVEGSLYFDRTKDVTLDSFYIFVLGGYMEVGTADQPFEKNAIITLHGDRYTTIEVPPIGSKCLAVADKGLPALNFDTGAHQSGRYKGQLEIHGMKRLRTWTKVNMTAIAGNNWIITSEKVDFKSGETVILTGNEVPDCLRYANCYGYEELIVLQTIDGYNVSFTTLLEYDHRSEIIEIEGRKIDMRCEIGLLSRNIIVQGDADNSDSQLFGIHTVAMMSSIYRIENAEIRRCGQAFNFGRYCTHSHKGGNMEGSYVKANSIHNSYQRAVTTHDTMQWEVRDNVAFDIQGHAYFVEDGTERRNSITGNLGILIRPSSALLPGDKKPSIFWTSTPDNFWRDNVAVHSSQRGMWFELPSVVPTEVGEDKTCPVGDILGEFNNNTFHSNSGIGLRIYPQWVPTKNPCDSSTGPAAQYLYNLLSYRNGGNGLFSKHHGSLHHISPTLVDNAGDEVSIVHYQNVAYDMNPTLLDALFVGTTNGDFDSQVSLGKHAIVSPQDEYFYVKNSTFYNYGMSGALAGCNSCLSGSEMNQGAFTTRYENIKFVNTILKTVWIQTKKEILWDLDGSLGGVADSMITRSYGSLIWPDVCTVLPYMEYSDSVRCGGNGSNVRIRRMQLENVSPKELYGTDLMIKSSAGNGVFSYLPLDTSGWVFPVVTGGNRSYSLDFASSGDIATRTTTLTLGRYAYLQETMGNPKFDESVIIRNNLYLSRLFDYDPYSFIVTYQSQTKWSTINSSLPLINMADSKYINYTFDVMLNNKGSKSSSNGQFSLSTTAKLCPRKGCPVPPTPSLGTPMLWSRKSSWSTNNYKLPTIGQNILIDSNMWIILDVNPPKLGSIIIRGKLSFQTNASSLVLQAQNIQLWGSMEIVGADNGTFLGEATVIIYGSKGASPPVTMGEGNFVGSKVISIAGSLVANGQSKTQSWTKLNATVTAGSNIIILSSFVSWNVGDEVIIAPTAYFNSKALLWSNTAAPGSNAEVRTIIKISNITTSLGNFSQITFQNRLNHTHLCETIYGESFCGAVGVLTRSIQFISQDSENPKSSSYGFGANIRVVDVLEAKPPRYGSINVNNVKFKNFGKLNSDHYGISIVHKDYNHPPSNISNCAFFSGYNFATKIINSKSIVFSNNVAYGNYGGGVYVDVNSINFVIDNNLLVGVYQLPSRLQSSYPWLYPIAAFSVFSSKGIVSNNVAAGSDDQGFAICSSMFTRKVSKQQCSVTSSNAYNYSVDTLLRGRTFYNNEAVAGKGGMTLVTVSSSESTADDCALLSGFKAWRNAYTGIMSLDTEANVLIANIVLAENHIGINLHFYKEATNVFSGIVASKIIGSLSLDTSSCKDLPDSSWLPKYQCHGFTANDPLGKTTVCSSVIAPLYRRVGILIPQWTNKPRTCGIAGRFNGLACDPPTIPDRLCQLPWDKRYGLPLDIVYAEQHIHDTAFIGFQTHTFNSSQQYRKTCIPDKSVDRSPALAVNPTQYDMQPSIIVSGVTWDKTDSLSRFSFETGSSFDSESGAIDSCADRPCSGHNQVIIHDLDGSISNQDGKAGQLLYNNPNYVAPYPICYEAANISPGVFFCPSQSNPNNELRQYSAVWRDWGPQVIQPIITTRNFAGEQVNRSFASYGPIDDMCAKRMYFSRFPLLIANGTTQTIMSTGTVPSEFLIRWDAPSESNVAVLKIFYQHSYDINVLVSDDPNNGFQAIKSFSDRYPTIYDPAGSNSRDPQQRLLIVTIRGGANRFYRFRQTPVVAVTMRLDMPFEQFIGETFIANMALLLGIVRSRIKIVDVRRGSAIVDFQTTPNNTVAQNKSDVINQVKELDAITTTLQNAIISGKVAETLNVTLLQCTSNVQTPDILQPDFSKIDYPANATINSTEIRQAIIAQFAGTPVFLLTYPTSNPTNIPSLVPTCQPSQQPIQKPSSQPSHVPLSQPSQQPDINPTGKPHCEPSQQPTRQPNLSKPTCQPLSIPSKQPSSQPSRRPSNQPSSQPRRIPSQQPSRKPSLQPSSQPTKQPSSLPSHPSCQPSSQPSKQPNIQPSRQPIRIPSRQPSSQPFQHPSSGPSSQPSYQPTDQPRIVPTRAPTSRPSCEPSEHSTGFPSSTPTIQPSHVPIVQPTSQPSTQPLNQPSAQPSRQPFAQPVSRPSKQPVHRPTNQPSSKPADKPSEEPISQPSQEPTDQPNHQPSIQPFCSPSHKPGCEPTSKPIEQPSNQPSLQPSLQPDSSPSCKPSRQTFSHPTHQPVSNPSGKPTRQPISKPTSRPSSVPTSKPNNFLTQPPSTTMSPSGFTPMTGVSFNVSVGVNGVSKEDIVSSPSAQKALTDSVKIGVDGNTPEVTISSITEGNEGRRQLTSSQSVKVTYGIQFKIVSGSQSIQPANLYDSFVSSVKSKVSSGNLTNSLKSSGLSMFSNISIPLSSLQFTSFQVSSNVIISNQPSLKPTQYTGTLSPIAFDSSDPNLNLGLIIGLSVGIGSLLIFACYCFFTHQQGKYKRNNIILYPLRIVPSDGLNNNNIEDDTFKDLEQIKTPLSDLRKRNQAKQNNNKNNNRNNNKNSLFDFPPQHQINEIDNDDIIPPAKQIPELREYNNNFDIKLFEHVQHTNHVDSVENDNNNNKEMNQEDLQLEELGGSASLKTF